MPAKKKPPAKKPSKARKSRYPKPDQVRFTVGYIFRSLARHEPGGSYMKTDISSIRRAIESYPDYVREFREKEPAAYSKVAKILAYEHKMGKKGKGAPEFRV